MSEQRTIKQRMEALGFNKPDVDDNVRDMLTQLETPTCEEHARPSCWICKFNVGEDA
jgi:transketolase N-terminal domain/subunit